MKKLYKKYIKNILRISYKSNGFMLVEVILSFAIFAIVMAGAYGLIITSMKGNKLGEIKQKSALYGQQLFEDIKGGAIHNKDNIYSFGDVLVSDISGGKKLEFQGEKDFGNGYKGYLSIKKNTSIILDRNYTGNNESSGDEILNQKNNKICNFNFNIKSKDSQIIISNNENFLTLDNTENNLIEFNIKIFKEGNMRIVKIESQNKSLITKKEVSEDMAVKLTINCLEYKLSASHEKYNDIKVNLFNECKKPVYMCINKKEKLDIKVVIENGVVKLFNNNLDDSNLIKNQELYDITIEIKNKKNTEFLKQVSQNINLN